MYIWMNVGIDNYKYKNENCNLYYIDKKKKRIR